MSDSTGDKAVWPEEAGCGICDAELDDDECCPGCGTVLAEDGVCENASCGDEVDWDAKGYVDHVCNRCHAHWRAWWSDSTCPACQTVNTPPSAAAETEDVRRDLLCTHCGAYNGELIANVTVCTFWCATCGEITTTSGKPKPPPLPPAQNEAGDVAGDPVNHPPHYNAGPCEFISALAELLTADEMRGFCLGNMLKYRWRARHKGKETEDRAKAEWYALRLAHLEDVE